MLEATRAGHRESYVLGDTVMRPQELRQQSTHNPHTGQSLSQQSGWEGMRRATAQQGIAPAEVGASRGSGMQRPMFGDQALALEAEHDHLMQAVALEAEPNDSSAWLLAEGTQSYPDQGVHMSQVFEQLDVNRDGVIDRAEFLQAQGADVETVEQDVVFQRPQEGGSLHRMAPSLPSVSHIDNSAISLWRLATQNAPQQ